MSENQYILPVPEGVNRQLAIAWLWLSIMALLLAGVFSLLLVLSRTPVIQDFFPWVDFFHTALVVHVDLSVLVWFAAFAGVLWSLNSLDRFISIGWLALIISIAGTLVITLSPFFGAAPPIMSNYIPVLDHPIFLTGLLLFFAGIILLVWRSMVAIPMVGIYMRAIGAMRFGLNTTAVSAALAIMAFIWSYITLPDHLEGIARYEILFWGGGHVLQFMYTLMMLLGWLWLSDRTELKLPLTSRVVLILFGIGLLAVFATPVIYYSYALTAPEHRKLFTWQMEFGGSLATLPFGLALLYALVKGPWTLTAQQHPLRAALVNSMMLFGFGGLIGFAIHGSNVTIPAHYHGCIVAVTLVLMGITYDLLPRLGFAQVNLRWANWQPHLYGIGQMLHISGLLWSGGYGVQRKVAGTAQGLEGIEQILAMSLMGIGGLISVTGGIVFIVLVLRSLLNRQNSA